MDTAVTLSIRKSAMKEKFKIEETGCAKKKFPWNLFLERFIGRLVTKRTIVIVWSKEIMY